MRIREMNKYDVEMLGHEIEAIVYHSDWAIATKSEYTSLVILTTLTRNRIEL